MVRSGWAIADKKQSNKYVEEEISAYKRKVGMWEGKFQEPEKWRLKNPVENENTQATEGTENSDKKTPFQKVMSFFKK
jgi:hypothetical protein